MLTPNYLNAQCSELKNKTFCIAYSGGVDSHVLLHLAYQTYKNIRAIHINHAVSDADDLYQQHCEQVCSQLNIPLTCIKVDISQYAGKGLENAARDARRAVWRQHLTPDDVLLLAHHSDDQAETILYRLLRGSGPHGLTGMRVQSKLGSATMLRPLLKISKQQILAYANEHKLQWLEDHSNSQDHFARNYLRNQIMPLLKQRWPKAAHNLNNAGRLCGELLEHLNPVIAEHLSNVLESEHVLDLNKLLAVGEGAVQLAPPRLSTHPVRLQPGAHNSSIQPEILRAWLKLNNLTLSDQRLQLMYQEVILARHDAQPVFAIGDKVIRRSKNKLFILTKQENPEQTKPHGRKAKKIFQQHGIPPWERHKYPLVFAGNRLVAIVGLWESPRF